MKNIKNYLNFINEELSPNKYLYVSKRLDDKVHKNRIDKLKSKFLENAMDFNIDIVDIKHKILYKNCQVVNITKDYKTNIENSVIVFQSELSNAIIWKTKYKNGNDRILSYRIDKPKNLYFTNRYDANRFIKYLNSLLLDTIDDKYSPNPNYYYISDDISNYDIK